VGANSVFRTGKVGCYSDNQNQLRDLVIGSSSSTMSIELCAQLCVGYQYFGVQFGDQCFCGNIYGTQGASNNCSMKCQSNATEICGGTNSNSVYSFPAGTSYATSSSALFSAQYIGCFADISSNRDLSTFAGANSLMTVETCAHLCTSYSYFGVQYGQECWCGNRYGSLGSASNCNMPCVGNSIEICGAGGANSVYRTGTGDASTPSLLAVRSTSAQLTENSPAHTEKLPKSAKEKLHHNILSPNL